MKKLVSFLMIALFVVAGSVLLLPKESKAVPAFARMTGQSCLMCHWAVPKLNPVGMLYKYNGYRVTPGQGADAWEWKTIPASVIIEVEAEANRGRKQENETNLKLDEVELMFASAIGERISAFTELEFDEAGSSEVIGRIQLDLTGKGNLNIAAGHVELDFPHLANSRRIVRQGYLADDIGFLVEEVVAEFNGQIRSEEGAISSYFYNAGVARVEDRNNQNKLASFYGTLTLGVQDHFLGFHYRFAREDQGVNDEDVNRFGIVPELHVGPFLITPGYFYADFENFGGGADLEANNFLIEVLYNPTNKLVLGLRGDYLDVEQGSGDGDVTGIIANATYYIMPNVYIAGELRYVDHDNADGVPIVGTHDKTEEKGRLFLFAMF